MARSFLPIYIFYRHASTYCMRRYIPCHHGFSLIELSIVLVILGLLIGGILAGQSLIRASELRSVTASVDKQKTALLAFRDKYFALPGDFSRASSFWPTQCTTSMNNSCDGDSNGQIDLNTACNSTGLNNLEPFRASQHLGLAGLIEGDYTTGGNATCVGQNIWPKPGINIPSLKIAGIGMLTFYHSTSGQNVIRAGGIHSTLLDTSFLTPEETWNLDTKMDDGVPNSGKFRAAAGSIAYGECFNGAAYTLTQREARCYFNVYLN